MTHPLNDDLMNVYDNGVYSAPIMEFAFNILPEREYGIFHSRSIGMTYKDIGISQGVTGDRIRQIYHRALHRMNKVIKVEHYEEISF